MSYTNVISSYCLLSSNIFFFYLKQKPAGAVPPAPSSFPAASVVVSGNIFNFWNQSCVICRDMGHKGSQDGLK